MDVLETLSGLQILYQLTCLSPCLIDRKTWTFKDSKLLDIYIVTTIVVSLTILLFSLFANNNIGQTKNNYFEQTVDFIQLLGVRVAHLASITEGLFRKKDLKKMYEEIKQVDRIFKCSLNVDVKNKEFHRTTLVYGFLMAFVYLTAELIILASSLALNKTHFLFFWFFYLMPLSMCGLRYFQMFTTIRILKHRFNLLINILNQINLDNRATESKDLDLKNDILAFLEASLNRDRKSCDMENPELKKLLIVRDLYNRLFHLNETLNCYFGVSILINVGNEFISILSNFYWVFYNYHDCYMTKNYSLLIVSSTAWSLPHLVNVVGLALVCESTVQKTNEIALNLHRIGKDISNDNHNTVIQQFSLQLLHQKMAVSAAGFFNVDCSLLYTIVGSTTTYLIILIQFHMSDTKYDHGRKP